MDKDFGLIKTNVTRIGDPFVVLYEGTYYMYATSPLEDFGIRVHTSCDVGSEWQDAGICYAKSEESFGYKDFWAPEVRIRADGKFVMHYSARRKSDDSLRIGVAVSNGPLGPFRDAVPGEPMFDPGWAAIDGHCFRDDDGKYYFYYVRDLSENVRNGIRYSEIYVSEMSDDLTHLIGESRLVLSPSQAWESRQSAEWLWNEGPFVIKHNGKYYLTYSSNCYDCKFYGVGYAVGDTPFGPFVKYENNPVLWYDDRMSGPGHNAMFIDKEGNLCNAFHIHTYPDKPSADRRACFCHARFKGNILEFY